ncbi:hypothetical protein [Devosia sp. XK-2]|uniref:hypothetical protein n=1 Tax=Devosia sp. XK-2 TaxID=3126689 RepID=UPI0030D006D1
MTALTSGPQEVDTVAGLHRHADDFNPPMANELAAGQIDAYIQTMSSQFEIA